MGEGDAMDAIDNRRGKVSVNVLIGAKRRDLRIISRTNAQRLHHVEKLYPRAARCDTEGSRSNQLKWISIILSTEYLITCI